MAFIQRRQTRSFSMLHSAQCTIQTSEQSPRKRRKATPVSSSSSVCGGDQQRPSGRRGRPRLLQAVIDSCRACVVEALRRDGNANLQDDDGYTALMVSVEVGERDMVELLINQGADATLRNRWGETALHLAVSRSDTNARSIVDLLLISDRSTVNLRPLSGCTPLFRAARNYHQDALVIVRVLVESNADLEVRGSDSDVLNGRYMAAFEVAATVGNFEVCQLLYNAGCNIGIVNEWMGGKSFPKILRRHSQWMGALTTWATQPRMLQEMCRIRIRRSIFSSATNIHEVTEKDLPLPFSLANLVLNDP